MRFAAGLAVNAIVETHRGKGPLWLSGHMYGMRSSDRDLKPVPFRPRADTLDHRDSSGALLRSFAGWLPRFDVQGDFTAVMKVAISCGGGVPKDAA